MNLLWGVSLLLSKIIEISHLARLVIGNYQPMEVGPCFMKELILVLRKLRN